MAVPIRALSTVAMIVALMSFTADQSLSQAQDGEFKMLVEAIVGDFLAKHPDVIERIVKDQLIKHPEVLQAAILDFMAKRAAANTKSTTDKAAVVRSSAPALFGSPHQVTLGDPRGSVTVVEFFDYNCGYCKRTLADMVELIRADPKLKIVLKEFPVLGQSSVEVARVAVGVRMQDADGTKYFEFHQKLLGTRGPVDKARALDVAREAGLDMARLEQDITSDEVRTTIEESYSLAKALGIQGTPTYVIGDSVVVGAVGLAALQAKVLAERR